jgi:hypothetical protein
MERFAGLQFPVGLDGTAENKQIGTKVHSVVKDRVRTLLDLRGVSEESRLSGWYSDSDTGLFQPRRALALVAMVIGVENPID